MHDLNAYTELGPLGSGGFADVVRALNIVTRDVVALKKSRTAPDCLERTKREIHLQRQLLHANVMSVLDWAPDGSWFTMPEAQGDLSAVHEREPVKEAGLLRLVEDVGAALAAAHRRGFVHRDLTPVNVLWLRDRWVVADWGFVKLPPGTPRAKLTRTGVGTECFTAPEVYRDGSLATPTCDIYSLGRVVGWLLVGPIEPGKPIPLDERSPWAKFVRETTRDDPAERPQTVDAALKLLEPVFAHLANATPILPSSASANRDFDVTTATAEAFKVLLQDPMKRIQLEELVDRETEAAFARLSPESFQVQQLEKGPELEVRLHRYVESCRILMGLIINGCAYGMDAHAPLWTKAIRRIGHPVGPGSGLTVMLPLRYFPTTLLMYAGGLAAVARGQWSSFSAVTKKPTLSGQSNNDEEPALPGAAPASVVELAYARTLPGRENRHTPASDWLFAALREQLRPFIRIEEDYEQTFDRFEYLLAMLVVDGTKRGWAPIGRFGWRDALARRHQQKTVGVTLRAEMEQLGADWGPIRGGAFAGVEQAAAALVAVEKVLSELNWY